MEAPKPQRCVLLLILGLLAVCDMSVRADEMKFISNVVVVARVLGPAKPSDGKSATFPVKLKIVAVHGDFATELRGEVITVPTTHYHRPLLGKTLPLMLSCHEKGTNGMVYSLMCTDVGAAYWYACLNEKREPVELNALRQDVSSNR